MERSEKKLQERLDIINAVNANKQKNWALDIRPNLHMTAVCGADGEPFAVMIEDQDTMTAAHIAANAPDVIRSDIEEILTLRKEKEKQQAMIEYLAQMFVIYRPAGGFYGSGWKTYSTKEEAIQSYIDEAQEFLKT